MGNEAPHAARPGAGEAATPGLGVAASPLVETRRAALQRRAAAWDLVSVSIAFLRAARQYRFYKDDNRQVACIALTCGHGSSLDLPHGDATFLEAASVCAVSIYQHVASVQVVRAELKRQRLSAFSAASPILSMPSILQFACSAELTQSNLDACEDQHLAPLQTELRCQRLSARHAAAPPNASHAKGVIPPL